MPFMVYYFAILRRKGVEKMAWFFVVFCRLLVALTASGEAFTIATVDDRGNRGLVILKK